MYSLIKPLFVALLIYDVYSSSCNVCVTELLITSPVKCPICNQSVDASEYEKNSLSRDQFEQGTGQTSKSKEANYNTASSNDYYNWTTCFVYAKPCNPLYKYRRLDGSCNNLKHPTWGMSNTAFSRILPAYYRDQKHALALGTNGQPRPLSRMLSTNIFPARNNPDDVTLMTMQWGQAVAHDVAISLPSSGSIDCCNPTIAVNNENLCLPIRVPSNDYFFSQYNVTCISEIRTNITLTGNCNHGPAAQINGNTHIVDLSLTYGSDINTAHSLREFKGGKLKVQKSKNGRDFPPNVPTDEIEDSCFVKSIKEPCYITGDVRANQNTEISVLQNVFLREHNRVAKKLETLHPEWDDETLYQESRAIVIAEYQHITYEEWLVFYIGKNNMKKYKLFPLKHGYTKYDSSINIMTVNSFATAAYRIGHSGIQGFLSMLDYSRTVINQVPISNWMDRPLVVQEGGNYDQFLLGLTNQPMQILEEFYTDQMTNLLFHSFGPYGQDLLSLDIERGRDHGLAPYIYYLEVCTGYKARTFNDLKRYISDERFLIKLAQLYNSVEDIDLLVGGVLEDKISGTRLGVTFLCIITEQFYRAKWGDRYWYEVEGQPHSFTKAQLQEIRKTSLARLICDSSDNINNIAPKSFSPPSQSNKIVDCSSIPEVNLSKWK